MSENLQKYFDIINRLAEYKINTKLPKIEHLSYANRLKELLSMKWEIYIM